MVLVTVYTNLGDESLVHGIVETEVDTIICSYETLAKVAQLSALLSRVILFIRETKLLCVWITNPPKVANDPGFNEWKAGWVMSDL